MKNKSSYCQNKSLSPPSLTLAAGQTGSLSSLSLLNPFLKHPDRVVCCLFLPVDFETLASDWMQDKTKFIAKYCINLHDRIVYFRVQTDSVSHLAYLSEVRVGVESTLVTDGGLTLGAGVVVRYSRWVGQLCGGAHWAQFAAWHGCDLWQRVG